MVRSRWLLSPLLLLFSSFTAIFTHAASDTLPWVNARSLSAHTIELLVNGRIVSTQLPAMIDDQGNPYLRAVDMLSVGLPIALQEQVLVDGYPFLPLRNLDGYRVDAQVGQHRISLTSSKSITDDKLLAEESAPFQGPRKPIPRGSDDIRKVTVRVIVNQHEIDRKIVLLQQKDRWLIARDTVRSLGLPLPDLAPLTIYGQQYLAIDTLWPYDLTIDPQWQLLSIDTRPDQKIADVEETWVEFHVNEARQPRLIKAFTDKQKRFYLNEETLKHSKLRTPVASAAGEELYAVDDMQHVIPVFDPKRQSLALYAGANAFYPNRLSGNEADFVKPDFDQQGALLNYALFGSHSEDDSRLSGQFELGAFLGRGFLSSQYLVKNITDEARENIRLESNLRIDWPEQMRSLIVGDTLNDAGAWGRPARFGGLKWGTNFSTQPGFITFPTEIIAGNSVVPSTVDIFVDNARRSSADIEPGPFAITDVPVVTGAGEMRVVTRDLFGRETVVTRPFYASSRLLKPGLHEYSYELGVLRQNFTRESNDYATGFASGTHRYGFNSWFTGELRAELSADQSTLGTAANLVWPAVAEFDVALAASSTADGDSGELASVGVRRQARRVSFGAMAAWRSEDFAQLGTDTARSPDALESTAYAAVGLGKAGSLSVSHVQRKRRDDEDTEFATLQYSISLPHNAHLRFSYLEPLDDSLERNASASISLPLGRRSSAMVSSRNQSSESTHRAELRRNLPAGNGFGYQLSAESGERERFEAGTSWRNQVGLLSVQAAQLDSQREYRASFDGGIALMDRRPYFSQRLDQSFALVEVPDMEGVSIYRDNQLLAKTNGDGKAIVPGLRDYQRNRIRLDDAMLPLDIEVASLERTTVPAYRQGVKLNFAIKHSRWVGFRLLDSTGKPVPSGARFLNAASGQQSSIGREGQGYIETGAGDHTMQAWWRDNHCRFKLNVPESAEPVTDLGELQCL